MIPAWWKNELHSTLASNVKYFNIKKNCKRITNYGRSARELFYTEPNYTLGEKLPTPTEKIKSIINQHIHMTSWTTKPSTQLSIQVKNSWSLYTRASENKSPDGGNIYIQQTTALILTRLFYTPWIFKAKTTNLAPL